MARKQRFTFVFAPQVKGHFRAIEKSHHSAIKNEIEEQLLFEPAIETRNRKPLRKPGLLGADWELRCGPQNQFRVLYRIDIENTAVNIVAVGIKKGDRLIVGGEEV